MFKNMSKRKRPDFLLRPLKYMLNFEVERWSLQQPEYKMDCTDYSVNCNCFEIWYFGHSYFPYANIKFKQASNSIISHFQKEYYPLIHDTLKKTQ